MKYYIVFIVFIAFQFAAALDIVTPIFWERRFYMNISDPNASGYLIASTSNMVTSDDFQGINVEADRENIVKKIVFNFGDCCTASNTTMTTLENMNSNSIKEQAIEGAQLLALVKRGNCNWSEKVSVVNNLSTLNNINVTAIFIYDNVTNQDTQVSTTLITGSGSAAPSDNAGTLPAPRNVLNMTDNDLTSFTPYPTIYFVPNSYGETLVQDISTIYNSSTPYLRYYWLITPYFDEVTWGDSQSFFSTSKGYIAYIIILAVVFIIAFVFLRWWRMRRRRQAFANGFNDGVGIRMQARTNQVDPLPVDIVNRLPIDKYSEDLIKNINCAICLEDFVPGKQDIRILPCGHGFCVLCIDPWLTQKSTLCPICKWDCLPTDLRRQRELQNNEEDVNLENTAATTNPTTGNPPLSTQPQHTLTNQSVVPPPILNSVFVSPPSSPIVRNDSTPSIQKVENVHEEDVSITISEQVEKDEEIPENPIVEASSSSVHSSHDFTAIDLISQEHKK